METVKEVKKMGRPATADYRKKRHRMSRIEDEFTQIIEKMTNDNDRKLVLQALEKLKF
ncbi:TPA: hypothetical protein QCU60_005213 [Bacillus cereus]|nr:hypothetical protein [Bacillus cereus]